MKLLIFFVLLSCVESFAATPASQIEWRKGGLEQALQEAEKTKKPLLVYWGAIWCPPCNILKAKAFTNPEFVEVTKSFVPVYLDGDSPDAQIWGERLQATGYPTLLVLDSHGKETERLVTYDPLPELIAQLKRSLQDASSIEDLLVKAGAATDSSALDHPSWRRLAHYDWGNDGHFKDEPAKLADALDHVAKFFPADLKEERKHLELEAMGQRSESLSDKKDLPPALRAQWLTTLEEVLHNPSELREQAMVMAFFAEDFTKAIFPSAKVDPERDKFIADYLQAFRTYRQAKDLSFENRAYSTYPFAQLSKGENPVQPELAKSEAESLRKELRQALKDADSEEKRVSLLNTISYVYGDLGASKEAEKILIENLAKVRAKNEMMSNIADLEEKQGHKDAALKWKERAYREAEGGSTRLQWGQFYVDSLIKADPKRRDQIEADARKIIEEAFKRSDSFYGRSWRSLDRLSKGLRTWATAQKIPALNEKVLPKSMNCADLHVSAAAEKRCESFVAVLAKN